MYDRRVVRGNTHASIVVPTSMQPDPAEIEKQRLKQEKWRREIERIQKREQENEIRRKMAEEEQDDMAAKHMEEEA